MTGIEPAYSAWEVDSKGSGRTHTDLWGFLRPAQSILVSPLAFRLVWRGCDNAVTAATGRVRDLCGCQTTARDAAISGL
jgi:hypothetical protein